VFLIDAAHQGSSRWQDFVDENENGLLGRELDALADDIDELANRQIRWDEVLLLVDGRDVALLNLLADNLEETEVSTGPSQNAASRVERQAASKRRPRKAMAMK
jgi:hypothetical protein